MPEFLEDPSVLTKDKLKSELVANNVTLPAGEQRKDVYVQLYLQHLTARNRPPLAAGSNSKGPPDFSSDEEREPTPVLGSVAAAGRSRASVGRVRKRTPGRGYKGGRLAVAARARRLRSCSSIPSLPRSLARSGRGELGRLGVLGVAGSARGDGAKRGGGNRRALGGARVVVHRGDVKLCWRRWFALRARPSGMPGPPAARSRVSAPRTAAPGRQPGEG